MMNKRFALLEAYEDLAEKESLCIREMNFEAVNRIQSKKGKVLRELERLSGAEPIEGDDKKEFNRRIGKLKTIEDSNAELLDGLLQENRKGLQAISKRTNSVSKFRKAYGGAEGAIETKGGLDGKA